MGKQTSYSVKKSTKSMKMSTFVFFTFLIVAVSGNVVSYARAGPNCDCQCSSFAYSDIYGHVYGNCMSRDHTGAVWCYVERNNFSCNDLQISRNLETDTGLMKLVQHL